MISHASPNKRNILVTLEISDAGELTLDIAARMAVLSRAELEGVFIEDNNLISLSELPFQRQISSCSLMAEVINPERMQRDLNAQARQAERMLSQCAKSMGVGYSFRIWRGQSSLAALNASFETDILSIVKSPACRRRVVAERYNAIENIYVLFDGDAQSINALLAARQLANNLNVPVTVLILTTSSTRHDYENKISDILGSQKYQTYLVYYDDLSSLINVLKAARNTTFIMETSHPLFKNMDFNKFLDTFTSPVLVVR